MKIVYFADDGETFYTEDACLAYEKEQKIKSKGLKSKFWNGHGKLLSIADLDTCVEEGYYLECYSDEEAKFICDYIVDNFDIYPFAAPPHEGKYYYDEDEEEWIEVEKLYEKYQKVLQIFLQ